MQTAAEAVSNLGMKKSAHGFDVVDFENMTPEQRVQHKVDTYNATVGNRNEADGYDCQRCKNKGFISELKHSEMFGYPYENVVLCRCVKVRNAIQRLERSGLKNIVKDYTFDKYQTPEPWHQTIKEKAMRFCNDKENNWFFIGGQSGAGKTHICTAIAVHYLKHDKVARYMLWMEEAKKLKGYANDPEKYDELIRELKDAPVLYIDDLFKTQNGENGQATMPTPADCNLAFEILNHRYINRDLITIISCERTLNDLIAIDEATAGRIAERTKAGGYCVNLRKDPSRNWRMRGMDEI